jgi:hypothetical protein
MLAYVFWHWPSPDVGTDAYEQLQQDFQRALADAAPAGFRRSVVFRVDGGAPWLGGVPAYADWYLLDGSAALDPLNVAAVSGGCQEPHDRAARAASAGVGSLLALHGEHADVPAARHMAWLAKPKGMPYADFYAALESVRGSLWRRQMVLGPTPEFGILSGEPIDVPGTFEAIDLRVSPIGP